jgi:hypothetical protein
VADSCKHGNEPWVSIKGGDFLESLSVRLPLTSQEGVCSLEFYVCLASTEINSSFLTRPLP